MILKEQMLEHLAEGSVIYLQCDMCDTKLYGNYDADDLAENAYTLGWEYQDESIYCPLCKDNQR